MFTDLDTLQSGLYRLVLQRQDQDAPPSAWHDVWQVQWAVPGNHGHGDPNSGPIKEGTLPAPPDDQGDDKRKMKGGLDMFFASRPGTHQSPEMALPKLAPGEKAYRCPFDRAHVLAALDMAHHVKACPASPLVGKQAGPSAATPVACPYNPAHRMPAKSLLKHMPRCPSHPAPPASSQGGSSVDEGASSTASAPKARGGLDMFFAANPQLGGRQTRPWKPEGAAGDVELADAPAHQAQPGDRTFPCPFDASHQVSVAEMTNHVKGCTAKIRVRDNTPLSCPFNANHVMPFKQLVRHLPKCPAGLKELGKQIRGKGGRGVKPGGRQVGFDASNFQTAAAAPPWLMSQEQMYAFAQMYGSEALHTHAQEQLLQYQELAARPQAFSSYQPTPATTTGTSISSWRAEQAYRAPAYVPRQTYNSPPVQATKPHAADPHALHHAARTSPRDNGADRLATHPTLALENGGHGDAAEGPTATEDHLPSSGASSDRASAPGRDSSDGAAGERWCPPPPATPLCISSSALCCCPFDAAHRMPGYQLPGHVQACPASPMVQPQPMMRADTIISCPFNPTHRLPASAMEAHLQWCPGA